MNPAREDRARARAFWREGEMAIINVGVGQIVRIPELVLDNGKPFAGRVRSGRGGTLTIAHHPGSKVEDSDADAGITRTLFWEIEGKTRSCPVVIRSRGRGETVCQVVIEEKRESLRLHCDAELFFNPIQPEELTAVAESILGRVNPTTEPEVSAQELMNGESHEELMRHELTAIRRLLERLTNQMDHLIQVTEGSNVQPVRQEMRAVEVLDCSATGLGFRHPEQLQIGTFVRLRLVFRTLPKLSVEGLAVIVRSHGRKGEKLQPEMFDMGARFTHIHEADRERIVRHIFKVQRNLLRDRRAAV